MTQKIAKLCKIFSCLQNSTETEPLDISKIYIFC